MVMKKQESELGLERRGLWDEALSWLDGLDKPIARSRPISFVKLLQQPASANFSTQQEGSIPTDSDSQACSFFRCKKQFIGMFTKQVFSVGMIHKASGLHIVGSVDMVEKHA